MIVRRGLLALAGEDDFVRADLRVREGRVVEMARNLEEIHGEETVDASGLLVLPGAIDPHVHFDEPGFTHREDFRHGTAEAAKGGVTTVIDMPCTSLPPITDLPALENKLAIVSPGACVDFAFFGGVSGHCVEESLGAGGTERSGGAMERLAPMVVGFKCYFISGMDSFTRVTHEDFARVLAEGQRLGRPILLHAEDLDYVTSATARAKSLRGSAPPEWSDYVASRPEAAELVACAAALALARGREASLHVVHVGTAAAAELLHSGRASCETCSHYLAFTSGDFGRLGAALKTAPVVKGPAEREGLWRLLAGGAIDFVSSDHAPCLPEEKDTGNPWTAYGGIPGTGTMLPYLLSEGLFAKRLSLPRFIDALCGSASRRYGLSARKGTIEPGKDADMVLVDPSAATRIEGSGLLSKGRITPFEGMRLKGRILSTYVRGALVYRARQGAGEAEVGEIVAAPGSGKFLTWGYR